MRKYSEYKDSGNYIIGEIPSTWSLLKLKRACSGFSNGTSATQKDKDDDTVPVTRIETISQGVINYQKVGHVENNDKLLNYRLEPGDILFSNINSYERVGNTAVYRGEHPLYHGMNLLRLRPYNTNVENEYLYHYMKSQSFSLQCQRRCKPAINQVSIPSSYVKDLDIPLPPLSEQHHIVSFLDKKTSQIDEYIATKEKEIEALKEWKKALIARVVTKGLNKNAKMKDSGISWIGEMPEHWEVKNLRNFLQLTSEKNHPDEQLLSVVREHGVIIRDTESQEENHNFIPDDLSGYKFVKEGQFVINKMKSWQGSYGVSSYQGIVSPAYYVCDLNFECKRFFNEAIRSNAYIPFFTQYSKGIRVGQWDLNPIGLKTIPFIQPPKAEQQAIVDYIDKATTKADKMIVELTYHVEYMKEYKQRLIADVVTGKINVQP